MIPTISLGEAGKGAGGQHILKCHILAGDYSTKGSEAFFAVHENLKSSAGRYKTVSLLISLSLQHITPAASARTGKAFCSTLRREVPVDTPSAAAPLSTMGGRCRNRALETINEHAQVLSLRLSTHPERKRSQLRRTETHT